MTARAAPLRSATSRRRWLFDELGAPTTTTRSDRAAIAFTTQTTLSVDDTAEIVSILRERFPDIRGPAKEDICYATSNRQESVKAVCARAEKLIVIGAPNSSNSLRLAEVGERLGVPAQLVQRGKDIDFEWLGTPSILGLTAGASAPEVLVREVVEALRDRFDLHEEQVTTAEENMVFKLPRKLTA